MAKNLTFEELVTACYRGVLQRDPENQQVVTDRAAQIDRPEDIIRTFLESAEFHQLYSNAPPPIELAANYAYDTLDIEIDVTPDQLDQMFTRVAAEWKTLGETEPHWSVLTSNDFRSEHIQSNLEAFYDSGQPNVTWMDNMARRNGLTLGAGQTCLELGCGVGRVTLPLANLFDHVHGYDISPGNLAEARAVIEARGVGNITLTQLEAIQEIADIPEYDALFTVIVLQHNPPPIQKYVLNALLSKLRPGGVAYFQLPTYLPDYTFNAKKYLATQAGGMEMHAVPMREVIKMLTANGCELVEVLQDNFTAMPGSHSFMAVKTA